MATSGKSFGLSCPPHTGMLYHCKKN